MNQSKSSKQSNSERVISMKLSKYEVAMIMELRKHDYGKFQIHKNRGEPYRLITSASYQLDPNQYDDDFSPEIIS